MQEGNARFQHAVAQHRIAGMARGQQDRQARIKLRDAGGELLERGLHMTRLLGHMTGPDAPDGALDMLLEIGDNVMTHRRRYNVNTAHLTVTDLLALDPLNPRSILFQLNEIRIEVEQLPNAMVNGQMSSLFREAMRLHSGLAVMTPEAMSAEVYTNLERELEKLSDILAQSYLS